MAGDQMHSKRQTHQDKRRRGRAQQDAHAPPCPAVASKPVELKL